MERFLKIYTASGELNVLETSTPFLSIALSLVVFAGFTSFYRKMHISLLFPIFCIAALFWASSITTNSDIIIFSFPFNRFLLLIVGIALLWFTFYINYNLFKKNWNGIFFVLNLVLYILLGYFLNKYNTVLAVPNVLQNSIFHDFDDLQFLPFWFEKIYSKQSILVATACCIVVVCNLIHIMLYWHICKKFTWKYTQNDRIQKVLQIILCLIFVIKPEIAICILGLMPFRYNLRILP